MANPIYDALVGIHRDNAKPFLHLADGTAISHAGFASLVGRIAAVLRAQGVEAGDRVAVHAAKTPETLALFFGCAQVGAVFLPLNTAYTLDEVSFFLGDAEPKLCVCAPEEEADIAALLEGRGRTLSISADSTGSFADAIAAAEPLTTVTDRGDDDLAALLYTSGTTGRSKGAMLTQNNLLSNTRALAAEWRFTADDVLIHALPIFHTHGLFVATNVMLAVGGSMIFHQAFKADAILDDLPRATALMGVPTFYTRLLASDRLNRELVSHMRLFVSGSAPLLAETHVEFEARTGHRILERYGMTETGMNTSNPYEGERRAGTVGFPLPGTEIRIADDSGQPLPNGEIGGVEVRGPNVFAGYWRLPEKTKTEFRQDGFFITGDVGMIDEDGYLHIVGRAKDLIISGGFNIYPKEIELVIDQVEGVVESAVIGLPHADFGEAPVAVIVGDETARPAVEAAVTTSLARFKQPKRLVFVSELPRNTMGKVQKAELRKQFGDLLSN
ncbi:malonyl-CoA synthase [Mesorhizobium sp. KR2-14]|uniref:malonate--CoA ligase n=1 Tax=Mesorhizobium sp. KR2-14 TaxID=3156610 RepID=UPI0032B46453